MKKITFEELMKCDEMRDLFETAVREYYYSMACEDTNFIYGEDILDYFEDAEVEAPWETYEEFLEADEEERSEWVNENCFSWRGWSVWFENEYEGREYALKEYDTSIEEKYEYYAKADIDEFWHLILEYLEEDDNFYNWGIDEFDYDEKVVLKWYKNCCKRSK